MYPRHCHHVQGFFHHDEGFFHHLGDINHVQGVHDLGNVLAHVVGLGEVQVVRSGRVVR